MVIARDYEQLTRNLKYHIMLQSRRKQTKARQNTLLANIWPNSMLKIYSILHLFVGTIFVLFLTCFRWTIVLFNSLYFCLSLHSMTFQILWSSVQSHALWRWKTFEFGPVRSFEKAFMVENWLHVGWTFYILLTRTNQLETAVTDSDCYIFDLWFGLYQAIVLRSV